MWIPQLTLWLTALAPVEPAPLPQADGSELEVYVLVELRDAMQEVERLTAEDPSAARDVLEPIGDELLGFPVDETTLPLLLRLDALASALAHLDLQLRLRTAVVEYVDRAPQADRDLIWRGNLANTMVALGNLEEALELQWQVVEARRALQPTDAPIVRLAEANLANTLRALGHPEEALVIQEEVFRSFEAGLPPDHRDRLRVTSELASTRRRLGDLEGALALQESVLEVYQRTLAPEDPSLLELQGNLANTRCERGDLTGAEALEEAVLAARVRALPAQHPTVLVARSNLAATKHLLGDHAGALALQREVVAAKQRAFPASHNEVLIARENLAVMLLGSGDFDEARAIQVEVLKARVASDGEDHPRAWTARANLGDVLFEMGELEEALALQAPLLERRSSALPVDHVHVLTARENLANTLVRLGRREEAVALVSAQVNGLLERLETTFRRSPREARSVAHELDHRLAQILFLTADDTGELQESAFTLVETRRHLSTLSSRAGLSAAQRGELARIRSELNDAILGGPAEETTEAWRARIQALSFRRDRALRTGTPDPGSRGFQHVDSRSVSGRLPAGAIAISYLRYDGWRHAGDEANIDWGNDDLLAFVVTAEGARHRVELGPIAPIKEAVHAWRDSLGKPIVRGVDMSLRDEEAALARRLRHRILDPVLELTEPEPGAEIFVCLDDFLHLVPLDALALDEEGTRVGDRYRVRQEVSFGRSPRPLPKTPRPRLLLVGDVDFDRSAASASAEKYAVNAAAPVAELARAGSFGEWSRLIGTKGEIANVAVIFEESLEGTATTLTRTEATKAALFESVAGARFVHLATHGWFAPESVLSAADLTDSDHRRGVARTVRGLVPMALCGLCLAGANQGRDAAGRVPGLLTAEELSSFDFSECELAVLSACETNVGIHRAGQGILSLQAALHAAGARSAVTSLWKVDDDRTKDLMQAFYENLWSEGMSKSEALWAAKRRLRDGEYPTADWAGWVLTGNPD